MHFVSHCSLVGRPVKIEYDRKADIFYIRLGDSKIVETQMTVEDFYVDMDNGDNLVGIEIWNASKNVIKPISEGIAKEVKLKLSKSKN